MYYSRTAICLRAVLVLVLVGASSSSLFALANRVFVSARSGNDANTCDNILAPCQTFAGAVTKLNPGGEAIVLDSGGYGPVTITKALTIEAPAGVTAFIHPPSGDAITISAGSTDTVVLRGLTLNGGSNNGVTVNSVGALFIENCGISGVDNYGIEMAGAGSLVMKNTDVKGCFIGVEIDNLSGKALASMDHCHLDGNSAAFRAETTSPGGSTTTVTNSTANNNSQQGWVCGNGSSGIDILNLESCGISANHFNGILAFSGNAASVVSYSNCDISNNGLYGVQNAGSGIAETRTNNTLRGNGTAPTLGTISSFSAQ